MTLMTVRRPMADGNPDWDKSRLSGSFSRRALLSLRAAVILSGGLVAGVAAGIETWESWYRMKSIPDSADRYAREMRWSATDVCEAIVTAA